MKILTYDEAKLNNSVVALGKFEGLHKGHMLLIDKIVKVAKDRAYLATVCTIDFPATKKINLDVERYSVLEACGVDVIVKCPFTKDFAQLSPEDFFKTVVLDKLSAKCIVVGSDFRFGYDRKGDIDTLRDFGIKYGVDIIVMDKLSIDGNVISTSLIKDSLAKGDIALVNRYLGRKYSITGAVVKGKQLGRTIGFPTANIIPDNCKLLPLCGVYETRVMIGDKLYKGLTNVGMNPTVDKEGNITVETNILDFSGELYDNIITVYFESFIRPEMKFSSLEKLVEQMKKDKHSIV